MAKVSVIAKSGNVTVSKSSTFWSCQEWQRCVLSDCQKWQCICFQILHTPLPFLATPGKHIHCQFWPFLATPWKEPDLETKHYCHFWELERARFGNIYTLPFLATPWKEPDLKQNIIATFGNSWAHTIAIPGNSRMSQIWKQLHCHFWPFLATPWKEPDLETKHYSHYWEFLGTHHCHSW